MLEDLRKNRIEKLRTIRKAEAEPYPAEVYRTLINREALDDFGKFSQGKKEIFLVGRIRSIRGHGGSVFFHIEDETGLIQIFLKKDKVGEKKYRFFEEIFDIGDFVQVKGILFKTKKGEKTLEAFDFKMLAKSLRPLPEKWHGLRDQELRFRKRYLDLIMNKEIRQLFGKRTEFIKKIRKFLDKNGFSEVETPVLEHIPGGAEAEPFITHHNALDVDLYLRISLELHLKRLIVGGYEKIYEIGKVFRNEGISPWHLQEFTLLEFYWTYKNYEDLMEFIEKFYIELVKDFNKKLKIDFEGKELDFKVPWPRIEYKKVFKERTGIDLDKCPDRDSLLKEIKIKKIEIEKENVGKGRLIDQVYKKKVRESLVGPCFLIHHPIEISPLAKKCEKDPSATERFQVLIAGGEVGNGFSELNDPLDQRERFLEQMKLRKAGDKEAQRVDEDFLETLEYGMPPTAGFGVSIDRLFMILANQNNVRETVFFPLMRPKG